MIRQFDVIAAPGRRSLHSPGLIVILSSHYLIELKVHIAAPLVSPDLIGPDDKVNLSVVFEQTRYTLALPLLASMPQQGAQSLQGELYAYADAIERGIQRLFSGF